MLKRLSLGKRFRALRTNPIKTAGLLLVVMVAVLGALELTDTTALLHVRKGVSGTIPAITQTTSSRQPSSAPSTNDKGQASSEASSDNQSKPSTIDPNTPLVAPYGIFVSNHRPGQNGTPMTEVSSCNTTPGASCYIKFTQAGIVKTLPTQTVDNTGTASWSWDIDQAGLTSGSWQVIAVASLGTQIKSTTDQVALEVR